MNRQRAQHAPPWLVEQFVELQHPQRPVAARVAHECYIMQPARLGQHRFEYWLQHFQHLPCSLRVKRVGER